MAYIQTAPVFADRYRFERVPNNWDTGRTGYTYLVRDLEKNRLGVIKRADITSKKAVEELRNEVIALKALNGLGVPNVYETGQAVYESKKYEYVVIEYIGSLRVEENLANLNTNERIEILNQFFSLINRAHKTGIVNGDIDLKHLFWDGKKEKLTVIDWGNAKLATDPRKKTEFSFDLARSAEIIYALTTLKGSPPATGSLALPNDTLLHPELLPLPDEFRKLCKWAYRTPVDGIQSPYTAQDLLAATQQWKPGIKDKKYPSEKEGRRPWSRILIGLAGAIIFAVIVFWNSLSNLIGISNTPPTTISKTQTSEMNFTATTEFITPTSTPGPTETVVVTSTTKLSPPDTLEPQITPLPNSNKNLGFLFAIQPTSSATHPAPIDCWKNFENQQETSNPLEGFSRREDTNWRFSIEQNTDTNRYIWTDFTNCLNSQKIDALAVNMWVSKMEILKDSSQNIDPANAGKGIGFFIEGENNIKREYLIWVDQTRSMHLRVREDQKTLVDNVIFIVNAKNLKRVDAFPKLYTEFPIQIYLELDNQGLDILYLREGDPSHSPVDYQLLDPNKMIRIDSVVFKSLGDIKSFGLIGYGGETQIFISPLVFYQR